jgi:hypothetical protein
LGFRSAESTKKKFNQWDETEREGHPLAPPQASPSPPKRLSVSFLRSEQERTNRKEKEREKKCYKSTDARPAAKRQWPSTEQGGSARGILSHRDGRAREDGKAFPTLRPLLLPADKGKSKAFPSPSPCSLPLAPLVPAFAASRARWGQRDKIKTAAGKNRPMRVSPKAKRLPVSALQARTLTLCLQPHHLWFFSVLAFPLWLRI